MDKVKQRIVVIGGGAAGFFGAIACAEANKASEVLILEKTRQLLAKVRISGGGRCNVTHHCFQPHLLVKHYPRGHKALQGPFSRFQPKDVVQWQLNDGAPQPLEKADGDWWSIPLKFQGAGQQTVRVRVLRRQGLDKPPLEFPPKGQKITVRYQPPAPKLELFPGQKPIDAVTDPEFPFKANVKTDGDGPPVKVALWLNWLNDQEKPQKIWSLKRMAQPQLISETLTLKASPRRRAKRTRRTSCPLVAGDQSAGPVS